MAEAGYQKRKAAGQTRPLSELAERAQRSRSDGIRSMDHGTSKGQLVPQAKQPAAAGGTIEGVPYRVLRELPIPSQRNRILAQLARMSPNGRIRHVMDLFGMSYQDVLTEGLINFLNALPGFNPGVDPNESNLGFTRNWGNLPLYKVCKAGGPVASYEESTVSQANSCLTGQAISPGDWEVLVAPGHFLSLYGCYKVYPSGAWRGNELAVYGPTTGWLRPKQAWTSMNLTTLRAATYPWALVPTRPQSLTYTSGYVPPGDPVLPYKPVWMTPRKPPGPRVKERKSKITKALIWLFNAGTETADLIEALHDALPDNCKTKTKGNKAKKIAQKGKDLYRCWDHIDLDSAIFNVIWNNAEDRVWAKLGIKHPTGRYGGAMGANKVLSEALGKEVSDLTDAAKQLTQQEVSRMTGLTFT